MTPSIVPERYRLMTILSVHGTRVKNDSRRMAKRGRKKRSESEKTRMRKKGREREREGEHSSSVCACCGPLNNRILEKLKVKILLPACVLRRKRGRERGKGRKTVIYWVTIEH